jgi:hypothetical protein
MRYVYLLQSIAYPKKKYVGVTSVLEQRLRAMRPIRPPFRNLLRCGTYVYYNKDKWAMEAGDERT